MPIGFTRVSTTFTRPNNTAEYKIDEVIASSTDPGVLVIPRCVIGHGGGTLWRVTLRKSDLNVFRAEFALFIFESEPTLTLGDGGAITSTHSDFVDEIDLPHMEAWDDYAAATLHLQVEGNGALHLSSQNLFVVPVARNKYTPVANEQFWIECTIDKGFH